MYKGKLVVSIIPARGGSKGIPRKNLKSLLGKPLIAHTIQQSLASSYVDQTIVSTEDLEIEETSRKYGATILRRATNLATDITPTESVLIDVIEQLHAKGIDPDYIVLLQPTSPIRRSFDIDCAIEMLIDGNADSLLSVYENRSFLWTRDNKPLNYNYADRPRRQDKKWEFVENGSIYITKRDVFVKFKNRLGGNILTYPMPEWASKEIDEPSDFELIEYLMRQKIPCLLEGFGKISLLIFDVDGVFTDGSVYVDEKGREMLKFSRIDGKGIELLHEAKVNVAVISSEDNQIIKVRMQKLRISNVFTGVKNKEIIYEQIKETFNLKDKEIAYCGDDLGDLEIIKKVGFAACPVNAVDSVKVECDYVSSYRGGSGFVRDICNIILKQERN